MRPLGMAEIVVQRRTQSTLKNAVFVALVVITNTVGNLLLAFGMNRMPDFMATPFLNYLGAILGSFWIVGGTVLLIISMASQLSLYTWADLSYVLPVTASAYVVTAILSKFFLHEHISVNRWVGVAVISLGVMLVSETPAQTKRLEGGVQ